MRTAWIVYVLMCLFALTAICFAFFYHAVSRAGLYDMNFEAFKNVLSEQQGESIANHAGAQMMLVILLMVITNALWAVGIGIALFRVRAQRNAV